MAVKWVSGQHSLGKKNKGEVGQIQKKHVLMVEKEVRQPYLED